MLNTFYPYTSLEVLSRILLPKDLSEEEVSRLNTFFKDYIEPNLHPAEQKLVVDGGYKWLALANPDDLKEDLEIELLQITSPTTTPYNPVTCVIGNNFIPQNKWGLYLFKLVG